MELGADWKYMQCTTIYLRRYLRNKQTLLVGLRRYLTCTAQYEGIRVHVLFIKGARKLLTLHDTELSTWYVLIRYEAVQDTHSRPRGDIPVVCAAELDCFPLSIVMHRSWSPT